MFDLQMFRLKRPCVSCPFRRSQGCNFQLGRKRIREILAAPAFQCHKTVDYGAEDPVGDEPQQCAGLMALLYREGQRNQIMQVAERLAAAGFGPKVDFAAIEADDVYATVDEAIQAHEGKHLCP